MLPLRSPAKSMGWDPLPELVQPKHEIFAFIVFMSFFTQQVSPFQKEMDPSLHPIESRYMAGCHDRCSARDPLELWMRGSPKRRDSSPCLL